LSGALKEGELPNNSKRRVCAYTTRSLRDSTATILLNAGVVIRKVQELLDHRHITTTQIYDKHRRAISRAPPTTCRLKSKERAAFGESFARMFWGRAGGKFEA
jgi:hypothetical protein